MITTFTQARQELENWIGEEAGRNPAFRRHLLDDPKGAIADFLGMACRRG